ncbi:ribonuclease HIII [Evansella sp. AB-P1]|uniref:ribonuclease HIII n=1 Tax=Evansella sp. AB-P1 TaxID=3037653 RepID=UPI00241F950F|nr:ribonuclease HIII [Evansella sp. AB-P1]MDG5786938.1 ribonuclease HIII [Evansella sp. AB-P1]
MSYAVIQVSKSDIEKIKKYYSKDLKDSPPQGAVFTAKTSGCSITAYKSGKVLFQGKEASMEASRWNSSASNITKVQSSNGAKNKGVNHHSYQPPHNVKELVLLGSDETGTGDYFGPMTVVCAHLTSKQMNTIESWGIRDSKMINDNTIREIAPRLVKECTYSLLVLKNEKYNTLQQQGMNQGQMKALLHHQAIENVLKKCEETNVEFEGVLIDQFVQPNRYFDYLKGKGKKWNSSKPLYFATKAENIHPAVAAASVLARYSFLKEMDKLSLELGITLPKGAGHLVDKIASEILQQRGKETLFSCTKWHFANTQKAMNMLP